MIKKILLFSVMSFSLSLFGQTQYDAVRNSVGELNGTARFVGMGGAMGALGADISVMGTNPAGIALFRGSDVSLSFGFNQNITNSNFNGTTMSDKRLKASFDQMGFVYSTKIGNRTKLRFFNVGFNYQKVANFNRRFSSGGMLEGASMSGQMMDMILGSSFNTLDGIHAIMDAKNPYVESQFNNLDQINPTYLGMMGVRTGLVEVGGTDEDPYFLRYDGINGEYYSQEEGGISKYDICLAFNVKDRFYLGATLGVYDMDYNRYSSYWEGVSLDGQENGDFTLDNWFNTSGVGVDFKLGVVVRPIEDSPFRLGLAIHTPIWYNMTDRYTSVLNTDLLNMPEAYTENLTDYLDPEYFIDYKFSTPWKLNVSMGTTISSYVALGLEYEFMNYSSTHSKDVGGFEYDQIGMAYDKYLTNTHTLRVGAEFNMIPNFSLRCGYNYQTSPIKESSVRYVPNIDSEMANYIWFDETRTDTEYHNLKARNTITLGIGYRGRYLYADLAYKYDFYKSDFYAFDDYLFNNDGSKIEGRNIGAKVDHQRHQLLFTLGVHF